MSVQVLQDYLRSYLTVGITFGVTVAAKDQREKALQKSKSRF
jgi:hypothetical protein